MNREHICRMQVASNSNRRLPPPHSGTCRKSWPPSSRRRIPSVRVTPSIVPVSESVLADDLALVQLAITVQKECRSDDRDERRRVEVHKARAPPVPACGRCSDVEERIAIGTRRCSDCSASSTSRTYYASCAARRSRHPSSRHVRSTSARTILGRRRQTQLRRRLWDARVACERRALPRASSGP